MKFLFGSIGVLFMTIAMGIANSFPVDLPPNLALLLTAQSLKCTFTDGVSRTWENEEWHHHSAKDKNPLTIHFDSIDLLEGKARGIGNQMAVDEQVFISISGINFIEITGLGNLMTTTVFSNQKQKGQFLAVHSRHLSLNTIPIPSQYWGTCKIFN